MTVIAPSRHGATRASVSGGKKSPTSETLVRVRIDGRTVTLEGRQAWAMQTLIAAGDRGVTPIYTPGPRWSDYVYKIRRAGFVVETEHEPHDGPFPGTHARYCLHTKVTVLDGQTVAA